MSGRAPLDIILLMTMVLLWSRRVTLDRRARTVWGGRGSRGQFTTQVSVNAQSPVAFVRPRSAQILLRIKRGDSPATKRGRVCHGIGCNVIVRSARR